MWRMARATARGLYPRMRVRDRLVHLGQCDGGQAQGQRQHQRAFAWPRPSGPVPAIMASEPPEPANQLTGPAPGGPEQIRVAARAGSTQAGQDQDAPTVISKLAMIAVSSTGYLLCQVCRRSSRPLACRTAPR
jgi:hypothetical protein